MYIKRLEISFKNILEAALHQIDLTQYLLLLLFFITVSFLLKCFSLFLFYNCFLLFHFFSLPKTLLIIIAINIIKMKERDQVFLRKDHNLPMLAKFFFCIHFLLLKNYFHMLWGILPKI